MASGIFRLFCKPSDTQPWGLLETFEYDDAVRRKRDQREGVLQQVRMAATRWYYNYAQFRAALFACEEQESKWSPASHVFGAKRQKRKEPGNLPRRPYNPPTKKPRKVRKAKQAKKGKRKC